MWTLESKKKSFLIPGSTTIAQQALKSHRAPFFILAGILLLGLGLRLWQVQQPYNDAFSWRQSSTAMMAENFYKTNPNIFYPEVNWSGPGPNYQGREFQTVSYIASMLYRVVGQQDWVGRLVAIVFGIWGIFALFQLVRRIWDIKHALAAALMMAIMPGAVFIDRSFLPDPAMVSLVTTSLWLFVAHLQTGRRSLLIWAAIIGCWGVLTKLPGAIIGLPLLYAFISIRNSAPDKRQFPLPKYVMTAVLVLIPVAAYYLWARHLSLTYPPFHFAGSENWIWDLGIRQWFAEKLFLKIAFTVFLFWLYTAPVLFLALATLVKAPPQSANPKKAAWLLHWWALGLAFYYFIGARELVDNAWNFHLFSPVVACFAGRGLVLLLQPLGQNMLWLGIRTAVLTAVLLGFGYFNFKSLYSTENARTSYQMGLGLKNISREGDLVLTIPQDMGDPAGIYYSRRRGWLFPPITTGRKVFLPQDDKVTIALLEKHRQLGADWFGVVAHWMWDLEHNHAPFYAYLNRHYAVKKQTPDYTIYDLRQRIK